MEVAISKFQFMKQLMWIKGNYSLLHSLTTKSWKL